MCSAATGVKTKRVGQSNLENAWFLTFIYRGGAVVPSHKQISGRSDYKVQACFLTKTLYCYPLLIVEDNARP